MLAERNFCNHCGGRVDPDAHYCTACGLVIGGPASPTGAGGANPDAGPHSAAPGLDAPTPPGSGASQMLLPASSVDPTAYRDLRRVSWRIRPGAGAPTRHDPLGVSFHGKHPVTDREERAIDRFGGVATLSGERSDQTGRALGIGLVAQGAGDVLMTTDRLIVSIWSGESIHGALDERSALFVFGLPWELVDSVSRPVKTTFSDRLAGGSSVTLMNFTTAIMNLEILPASRFADPPRSRPIAKLKAEEAMSVIVRAAVSSRRATAVGSEIARLDSVGSGACDIEDGEFISWITQPDDSPRQNPAL